MLRTLLASALFAGLIAGLFAAGLQLALLVPIIAEAELYETGALAHFPAASEDAGGVAQSARAGQEAAPADGGGAFTRNLLTVLTTVLATSGFGLILVAGFALAERMGLVRVDLRTGLMFGLAGFAATQLMPSIGLAPELPGAAAGELISRQLWWVATVVATLAGIGLMVWGSTMAKIAGAVLVAVPHVVGAPHPQAFGGVVPPELSALFTARALAVSALAWAALGALAGHFWSREAHAA